MILESKVFIRVKAKIASRMRKIRVMRCIIGSCHIKPIRRNSVLEALRVKRLATIHGELITESKVFIRVEAKIATCEQNEKDQ